MRIALKKPASEMRAEHLALSYYTWAPVAKDGKVSDNDRTRWLSDLATTAVSPDYRYAFTRWKTSFGSASDQVFELELGSRLLVGHGNSSATDVGLTLQHTWGVPIIPGSALKGLLAHYVDTLYGPDNPEIPPWEQRGDEQRHADWQGVLWSNRRIMRGPGASYRKVFGAPESEGDDEMRAAGMEAGAAAGLVVFHDAVYVPGSAIDDRPFAVDVITVHQKRYYDTKGNVGPNDYEPPNPVAFLTVRPPTRMLFSLSGPADWTDLARALLADALREWGVGGKTSSGYGRLTEPNGRTVSSAGGASSRGLTSRLARHKRGDRITVTRVDDPSGKGKIKFQADDGVLCHFAGEVPPAIGIGETVEVWIANVTQDSYTLTLKEPKRGKR